MIYALLSHINCTADETSSYNAEPLTSSCHCSYTCIQHAWSCNRFPRTNGLNMRDFIPDEGWEAANVVDGRNFL
ncbi:hypothetical protein V1523DRAFT_406381 [Lipomyces doorenjongii]